MTTPAHLSPVDALLNAARQALWDTPRAQVLIARDLGISTKHLSMIRQGHADPSLDLLRRLCALLDIPAAADRDGYRRGREEVLREVRALAEVWSRSSEYRRVSHLGDRLRTLLDGPDTGRRP